MSRHQESREPARRRTEPFACTVLALLSIAATTWSHGSSYIPPTTGTFGPPQFTGPSSPSTPGGPGHGHRAATQGPPAPSHPQVPGTSPNVSGAKSSGLPGTGLALIDAPSDPWELWWHDNEERFLDLRARLTGETPSSGPGVLTGRGRVERGGSRRAAAEQVERDVLPLLFDLLAHDDEPEVLDSALIALGRCADESDADRVLEAVKPQLSSKVLTVQTSAVLALGIHGSPRFVPLLGALMGDASAGRAATGGEVPPLVRALAALSLGLGNHPAAEPLLAELLPNVPDAQSGLKSCAITALGVIDNDAGSEALGTLLGLLKDRRLDAQLKLQVPLAVARLDGSTHVECLPALLAVFTGRDTDDRVRTSLAEALGRLADPLHQETIDALDDAVHNGHHDATRHAALMALAEIGLRDVPSEAIHPDLHAHIAGELAKALQDTGASVDRPWYALAAGVYARGGGPHAAVLYGPLLDDYRMQKDPSTRGALALALGLADVVDAADPLLADFRHPGDPLLRGHAALALGLLGVRDAVPEMLAMCADKATEPLVREQVALALALLRDQQVVPTLLDVLGRVQVHPVSLSVARALGRIGDRSAIPALAALAADKSRPQSTRGMAVVALGLLGERGELPWNATLRELRNRESSEDALDLVFDIL